MTDPNSNAKPPLLTADLPGIGGDLKTELDDFVVEEIPAYTPCGEGDFLFLWIEKRDMSAEYLLRQMARRLDISDRDIGTAGLKDRRAVTRQWVSVPVAVEERLAQLESDDLRVLQVERHTNKLKSGHLRGNRFCILIRDPTASDTIEEDVTKIVQRLQECGLPNFYGPQRFGRDGETAQLGMDLLRDETRVKKPFLRKLALSAAQSVLFNHYLAARLQDGLFRRVLSGDVMSKWPAGGLFVAQEIEHEQPRFDAREIVTTGPIFGRKTFPAEAEAAQRERAVLDEFGLTVENFGRFGKLLQGTRRHNLVYVDDLQWARQTDGLQLRFTLPSGSYATVLLREVMKTDPQEGQD